MIKLEIHIVTNKDDLKKIPEPVREAMIAELGKVPEEMPDGRAYQVMDADTTYFCEDEIVGDMEEEISLQLLRKFNAVVTQVFGSEPPVLVFLAPNIEQELGKTILAQLSGLSGMYGMMPPGGSGNILQ